MATLTNAQALAYIASYRDLSDALGADADAGRRHFEQFGQAEGRQISFAPLRYIASYADLIRSIGTDAEAGARHFISFGRAEGRVASFDALRYTASHADLVRAFGTDGDAAAAHYIRFGFNEGRPTTLFNARDYVAANPDLIRAGLHNDPAEATRHYLRFGFNEQRATSGFDAVAYLLSNPDLGAAGLGADGALDHWLRFGAREGRTGDAPFGREQGSHALVNAQATDRLETDGDRDWFAVTLTAGVRSVISVNGAGGGGGTLQDGELYLYDASGRLVASDLDSGPGSDARLAYTAAQTGTFYAEVRGAGGATGGYKLAFGAVAEPIDVTFTNTELSPQTQVQGSAFAGDNVRFVATPTLNQASFSGFQLADVERFFVSNGSAGHLTFDMSGATGLTTLVLNAGNHGAMFDKVNSLAALYLSSDGFEGDQTRDAAVRYADAVTAGSSTRAAVVTYGFTYDDLTIGSVSDSRGGVEAIDFILEGGESRLQDLLSNAAELTFSGAGSMFVVNPLSAAVATITSTLTSGYLYLNASLSPGLTYAGSNAAGYKGSNRIVAGAGSDRITTFGGDDVITTGAGEDIISTGAGFDRITVGQNISPGDRFDGGADGAALVVGGRAHSDLDFANAVNISLLEASDQSTITIGSAAQAAGIRAVNLTSQAASTLDASAYTVGLQVAIIGFGGDDIITTGSGNDVVILGPGNQQISLRGGDDLIHINGSTLNASDSFNGGEGRDTINFVTLGAAVADLSKLTSIERYFVSSSLASDSLTFTGGSAASAVTSEVVGTGPMTVILGSGLAANQSFAITGAAFHATNLIKQNTGIANPFSFQGGSVGDTLQIAGADLTPQVSFNGADGIDRLVVSGTLTDAGLARLTSVEILSASSPIDVTLGSAAQAAGIVEVSGLTAGNNRVVVSSAFSNALRIDTSVSGDNVFDASASSAPITFIGSSLQLQEADVFKGGTGSSDVLEIAYVPSFSAQANLVNMSGVEKVLITAGPTGGRSVPPANPVLFDTSTGDLNGTTFLRIIVTESPGNAALPRIGIAPVDASAATANIHITGGIDVKTGSGNDRIEMVPIISNDFLGNPSGPITQPRVDAGAGQDRILGSLAVDFINGGAGADRIYGGFAADQLTGGAEADAFIYLGFSDSRGANADTITDFESGVDVIDVRRIADQGQLNGDTIRFAGNAADLAAAQALLTPGDNSLDAVFQQDSKTLWFDNGDGVLDAADLKIMLTGVTSLSAADVLDGATVAPDAAFLANFLANDEPQVPPSAVEPFQSGTTTSVQSVPDFF